MTPSLSPAMRHFARVMAERTSAATVSGGPTSGSPYELMLHQLAEHRRSLKSIQSVRGKIALKIRLLPDYDAWIDGVLAAGNGGQDDVLTTTLVWYIDVGQYERALQVARYAVQHKMTLPDQYSRDIPTMLLDEFAGAYLTGTLAHDAEQAVRILGAVAELTVECDTPDQARAKLYKALGYAQLAMADGDDDSQVLTGLSLQQARLALQHLQHAIGLFDGVGIKRDIERLERRLSKATQG